MGHLGCGATYLTMSPILLLGGTRRHHASVLLLALALDAHNLLSRWMSPFIARLNVYGRGGGGRSAFVFVVIQGDWIVLGMLIALSRCLARVEWSLPLCQRLACGRARSDRR